MSINSHPHIHEQVICANIFVRKDDKYLVLRRSSKKKYAPNVVHPIGGKVEPGENPYTAALRELYEEAGVKVKNIRLEAVLLELKPVVNEPYDWTIFHFSGDYDSGEIHQTDEGELIWLTKEELIAEDLFPSVREVIKNILNPEDGTVFATLGYDEEKKVIIQREISSCSI